MNFEMRKELENSLKNSLKKINEEVGKVLNIVVDKTPEEMGGREYKPGCSVTSVILGEPFEKNLGRVVHNLKAMIYNDIALLRKYPVNVIGHSPQEGWKFYQFPSGTILEGLSPGEYKVLLIRDIAYEVNPETADVIPDTECTFKVVKTIAPDVNVWKCSHCSMNIMGGKLPMRKGRVITRCSFCGSRIKQFINGGEEDGQHT